MTGILQGLLASIGGGGPLMYSWGRNQDGQLGLNNRTNKSSPTQIGDLTTWSKVEAGGYMCLAIKEDGSLWSWGLNNFGQVGDGTTTNRSSPVQIGTDTDWASISVATGNYNVGLNQAAIKTNGTLWAWGVNNFGQLGQDNRIFRSSPVQVGALTTWSKVRINSTCAAIKTDNTLWIWGSNGRGELGNSEGFGTNRSSPIQVTGSWSDVSVGVGGYGFVAAIRTTGTLFTWGYNASGQLGLNNTEPRSSPVQVGGLTTWSNVSLGGAQQSIARKTDGTLWSWGNNGAGQLGINLDVYTNKSSPVQIGALTDWKTLGRNGKSCAAIKTNDTLWTWGQNAQGAIGDDSINNRSSPVQIGSGSWNAVSCGYNWTIGIEK